jgi:hypothetical protein
MGATGGADAPAGEAVPEGGDRAHPAQNGAGEVGGGDGPGRAGARGVAEAVSPVEQAYAALQAEAVARGWTVWLPFPPPAPPRRVYRVTGKRRRGAWHERAALRLAYPRIG